MAGGAPRSLRGLDVNDPAAFVDEAVRRIREQVPGKAIIAASGGIDSTTAALLVEKALGDRARAIFVDTGLLRAGEVERVSEFFRSSGLRFDVLPAADQFFRALEGVTEPEEKRRADRHRLHPTLRDGGGTVRHRPPRPGNDRPRLDRERWLAPGHDQDAPQRRGSPRGQPARAGRAAPGPLQGRGAATRAPSRHPFPDRQPFPGPGLAVRVNGVVTPERVRRARVANAVVEQEVERAVAAGTLARPWQVLRGPPPHSHGGGHRRQPGLRRSGQRPHRRVDRRDDRDRHGRPPRDPEDDRRADHPGADGRGGPGALRRDRQTSRHDRVGVAVPSSALEDPIYPLLSLSRTMSDTPSDGSATRVVRLPEEVARDVEKRIQGSSFGSVDAFVTFVLARLLEQTGGTAFSEEDEKALRERLRSLGYID